jgi:hypothetical protein
MTEAAWSRNPRAMLESLRDGRRLYLEHFPQDLNDDLLSEFSLVEAKILCLLEAESRRVS